MTQVSHRTNTEVISRGCCVCLLQLLTTTWVNFYVRGSVKEGFKSTEDHAMQTRGKDTQGRQSPREGHENRTCLEDVGK